MQAFQNLDKILNGSAPLPPYKNSPTIDQVLNFLDRKGINAIELGDSSPIEFTTLEDNQCMAIVGMSTCVGMVAYSPKTKSVSGIHASLFDSGHLN